MKYNVIYCTEQIWLHLVHQWWRAQSTNFPKVWGGIDAIKRLIWIARRSWCESCLIEQVIPPHERQMLIPAECIHYASQVLEILFRKPISDEFQLSEAVCRDKSHRWMKYIAWKFVLLYWNPAQCPEYIIIYYITPHHNSPGLGTAANIAMYRVGLPIWSRYHDIPTGTPLCWTGLSDSKTTRRRRKLEQRDQSCVDMPLCGMNRDLIRGSTVRIRDAFECQEFWPIFRVSQNREVPHSCWYLKHNARIWPLTEGYHQGHLT